VGKRFVVLSNTLNTKYPSFKFSNYVRTNLRLQLKQAGPFQLAISSKKMLRPTDGLHRYYVEKLLF